ncbi:hypothetical protein LSCM1_07110 [Leishmania martiniquensis]|uniref:Uncharacterized protein n=1 Tax=Leishmania martiniquensis TaxID=1580590 RepID=A0A836KW44_9TRYP|nr:hypothetical protein LSCM1_07110 [Leishmania martiniquensis]
MSESRQFLKGLDDKPHHITIPLEDWQGLTCSNAMLLRHRYGVSHREVCRRLRKGDLQNRTFRIKHIIPQFLSVEELWEPRKLSQIAKERNLFRGCLLNARRAYKKPSESVQDATVSVLPPPLRLGIGGALAQTFATRATLCFGLHLLLCVENEDAEQQSLPLALRDVSVRAHLERLPLAVLHHLISELCEVRAAWERDLLASSAAAAVQEQAILDREAINALLYHVCLWQRRYPLALVSAVLSFYDDNKQLFSAAAPASRSIAAQLESLLEEVHSRLYPDLSSVPGLIRCDVFMTYPHMPLEEQRQLMREIAAAVAHREATSSPQRQVGKEAEEECVTDNLMRHSRTPPDPQLLLHPFVTGGSAAIPERFCTAMSTVQYHALRNAFELHKHDGVRRLAAQDYGRGSAYLTPPCLHQSAPFSPPS